MASVRQLLRNTGLAAATVWDHLGEDPALLALQASRRLPQRIVAPGARALMLLPGSGVLPALAAHIVGDTEETVRRLEHVLSHSPSRARLRAADVALAAHRPELADRLLASVGAGRPGRAGTEARRLWYSGEMSRAVAVLQGSHGRQAERQRRRLASEVETFNGFRPRLASIPGYRPNPDTVLHLLTNSLPHTQSGYAQRTHSLLVAQQRAGLTVHAVTRLGYPVQVGRLTAADCDRVDGVTYHRLLAARLPEGMTARLQAQAEMVLRLALKLRPEVLHTTTHFVNGVVARSVAEALGIPWIYEVRGQLADTWASSRPLDVRTSERYRLFRRREAETAMAADRVVTLGDEMKRELVDSGVPDESVLLLPNAVGEDFLDEPLTPAQARQRLGLPEDTLMVGTVSSLVDYEGLDDLIRALAVLRPDFPTLHGLIVGDGAAAPALRSLVNDLGLADRMILPGRVARSEARLYHQALDIFVVPRRDLAVTRAVTPLKPVEALASARPVVASDLPALREIVSDGSSGGHATGAFFEPGDWQRLAEVLRELLMDPDRRGLLGRQGRAYVLAERTWQSNARAAVHEYAGLRKKT